MFQHLLNHLILIIQSATLIADGTDADQGKALVTNIAGKIEGFFTIPEHSFSGQENVPKFETQKELQFRLTSSETNSRIGIGGVLVGNATAGQENYSAVGVLETTQETITSTKNAKIVVTNESQTTSITETGSAYQNTLESNYTSTYVPPPPPPPPPEPLPPEPEPPAPVEPVAPEVQYLYNPPPIVCYFNTADIMPPVCPPPVDPPVLPPRYHSLRHLWLIQILHLMLLTTML